MDDRIDMIECDYCWWTGDVSELLYNEEDGKYNVCPQCLEVDTCYDWEEVTDGD